jgi:hypothetical protein
MRLFVTAVILAGASPVMAQTAAEPPVQKPVVVQPQASRPMRRAAAPGMAPGETKTTVAPTTPVVTLKGVCKDRQPKSACETVITREDLDRYAEAFAPDAAQTARGREAAQYAGAMMFSSLAEQQGLDKNPALAKELDYQLKLVRMRFLASIYLQNLQRQTTAISEAEIEKYYSDHQSQYEQVQLRRLSVPFAAPNDSGRFLDHAAVKAEMEEVRRRAVAGEDLDQLLQDAYKHLHIQASPPAVAVATAKRNSLQGDEAKALDLNAGEFSAVLDLPASMAIIKIESKDAAPLQFVRQEIEATLRAERMKNEVNKLGKKVSAEFNLEYLGMPSQPDLFALTATNPSASRARTVAPRRGMKAQSGMNPGAKQ